MGFFFYFSSIRSFKSSITSQNENLLIESVSKMDSDLELMKSLTTQITSNAYIRSLVQSTETSPEYNLDAFKAKKYLGELMSMQSLLPIERYYIYLPQTDHVLSSTVFSETGLYYNTERNFISNNYHLWLHTLENASLSYTFTNMNVFSKKGTVSYLYKLPITSRAFLNQAVGYICFDISIDKLKDVFSSVFIFPKTSLLVTDSSNNILFVLNNEDSPSYSAEDIFAALLKDGPLPSHVFNYRADGIIITPYTSSNNNWRYYLFQSSDVLYGSLNSYHMAYIFTILLACAFAFTIIFILSKRNIKPVISIGNQLEKSLEEQATLKDTLELQKPLIHDTYLSKLMSGLIVSEQEASEIRTFFNLSDVDSKYNVLYLNITSGASIDSAESMSTTSAIINVEYKKLVIDLLYKFLGEDILVYQPKLNSFAVLLKTYDDDYEAYLQKIDRNFSRLHSILIEEHSIWIYGGIGNFNTRIAYIWKSYQQAFEAASFSSGTPVLRYFHRINRMTEAYYYPFEMAQQLTNFIKLSNDRQIAETFKLIYRENYVNRSISHTTEKWLLSDIRSTFIKLRYALPNAEEYSSELEEVDNIFHYNIDNVNSTFHYPQTDKLPFADELKSQHGPLYIFLNIALLFSNIFAGKPEENSLIISIRNYIDANYSDSALSLKKISDEFKISESYFSYLFKTETKQNFSEYLEHLRMEHAMRLIKDTDTPLSDIYVCSGYNNANSFRRAFKKTYGVSPKAIRDNVNEENE